MLTKSSDNRRLLATGVLLLGAGIVLACLGFSSDVPPAARVVCLFAVPTWFIMVVVLMAKMAVAFGLTAAPKGELERLLERKRGGGLLPKTWSKDRRITAIQEVSASGKQAIPAEFAHYVQEGVPGAKKEVAPSVADVLDRLLDWKRHHDRVLDQAKQQ